MLAALAVAGLAAGILVPGGGASSQASDATSRSQATTRVNVTAREFKFTLSKRSVPTGTVIFTVTNKGKISHDFKIAGKKTPRIAPGHSATLRVTFSKQGRYPYLSTVSGQASAGMKGSISVVAPPTPTLTTHPTFTTIPTAPPATTLGTANTTVDVGMFDRGVPQFVLSQQTIPSGMVTFVITSTCDGGCTFDLEGIKAGALLFSPSVIGYSHSETWTVALPPGIYRYHCDVFPPMRGSFTVTP